MPVFHSFKDFAASRGLRPKAFKERPFVCRKCGKEMRHIPNTNVVICENVNDKGEVCGNRVLLKNAF